MSLVSWCEKIYILIHQEDLFISFFKILKFEIESENLKLKKIINICKLDFYCSGIRIFPSLRENGSLKRTYSSPATP